MGLIPICTALLAPLFGEERLSVSLCGALLLGFFGVALIVLQQPLQVSLHSGFLFGALCLAGNTFSFALYSNLSKRSLDAHDPPDGDDGWDDAQDGCFSRGGLFVC